MARGSSIEWTEATWNPVTGCTKTSPGCRNCYAERMAFRLKAMGQPNYAKGFEVSVHEHALDLPLSWRRPQMVFVNSMGDLFHRDVPAEFVRQVFDVMRRASWHVFQVLTKRSERLQALGAELDWPPNVWMGVSVETNDYLFRLDHLRHTPAHVKFVSAEPLLGQLGNVNLMGIDWVIVGGESGPRSRPMEKEWIRGHQAGDRKSSSTRISALRATMADTSDESRPPESKTPKGTSDINRLITASVSADRMGSAVGVPAALKLGSSQAGLWYRRSDPPQNTCPGGNCSNSGQTSAMAFISEANQRLPSGP